MGSKLTLIILLAMACASCSKTQNVPQTATAAAITAGAAVAAAAIHREVTDYKCWGNCTHGYVCDQETSKCVLPSELKAAGKAPDPELSAEERGCIEEEDGSQICPDDPETEAPEPDASH